MDESCERMVINLAGGKCQTVYDFFVYHVEAGTVASQGLDCVQGPPGQPDDGLSEEQERNKENDE